MELEFLNSKKGQVSLKEFFSSKIKALSFPKILYYIFVFFISAVDFPLWSPSFGCSVFAAQFSSSAPILTASLILTAGLLGRVSLLHLLKTVLSILLFSVAATKFKAKTPLKKGIIMALATLFCSAVPKIFSALFFYDAVLILLESLAVFVCTILFYKAKEVIFSLRDTPLKNEEMASVMIFFAISVMGISRFEIFGINTSAFFCALSVLIFSYRNGIGAGSVSGILMGLVFGISSGDITYSVFSLSLSAMLSGFFSRYGKASCAISFLLAVCIATYFSDSTVTAFINLSQMSIAVMFFIFLPEKVMTFFDVTEDSSEEYNLKLKKYISSGFLSEAGTIREIADVFSSLCKNSRESESASSSFFERTTHRICGNCSKKNYCWRSEFHRTYTSFFVLLEICNHKGYIVFGDIPDDLVKKCDHTGSFVSTFNSMYELYKVDRLWECRIMESRYMVSKQLECIADNLKKRAENTLVPLFFNIEAEENILHNLQRGGIDAVNVFVCSDKKITIVLSEDYEITEIEKLASEAMGENLKCIHSCNTTVTLAPFPGKDIAYAILQKAKSGNIQCGDSGLFSYLENGNFMMILSDGMGSGERAKFDSTAVTSLSEKLMSGGFSATSSAEIINSALLLKSSETAFASVDMAIINLFDYRADFYKMGAAPAFIKRGNAVKTIYSTTLPAGTFSKSDIGTVSQDIKPGDVVILVSDGIANGENTPEIERIISEYNGTDAEEMAKRILDFSSADTPFEDDMTVMVAFIV